MHQPCAAIAPSTFLQDEGASNSSQFSQRCSPFGVSWYFTIFCDTLAASAAVDVPRTAVAPVIDVPAAPAAMVKTCRREIPRNPIITRLPAVRGNRQRQLCVVSPRAALIWRNGAASVGVRRGRDHSQ